MTTPLEYIREKAIEANPEIKELNFGCLIKTKDGVIPYGVGLKDGYDKGQLSDVDEGCGCCSYHQRYEEGTYEIIGRPIQAQDVLKALPYNWMLKSVEDHYEFIDMNHFGTKKFTNTYVIWQKGTLEDQTPQRLERIATLLGYKK